MNTIEIIEKVLKRYKNMQLNLSSESARKMLAAEIDAVLTSKITSNR